MIYYYWSKSGKAAPTRPHKRYPGKGSSKGGPFTMRMKVEHLVKAKEEKPVEPFNVDRFIRELYQMDPELIFRGKVLLDQRKVIDLAKRATDNNLLQQ